MKKIFFLFAWTVLSFSFVFAQSNNKVVTATPVDTIDVVCHDLELSTDFLDMFGMAYIFANNSDYNLTGAIFADSIPPGTYTNCVMDLKHIATQKQIPATSVILTLGVDANRNCVITGTMIGEDNICYNLHLSWTPPAATDTVQISFPNSASVAYYPDLGHDFMLSNHNEDYNISLDIVNVPMGESFTEKNLNIPYCLIANKQNQDTIKISSANGQVWQSNDTTYLSADIVGFDAVLYRIDLWYAVPAITETKIVNISNATFYNKLEEEGYYALIGTTEDKSIEFAISLLGNSEDDIAGTYTNDGLFGGFSGENYDFINFIGETYSTYVALWNEDKKDYDIISIEKGSAVVTKDDEQNVTLNGSFVGKNGVQYTVSLTTKVDIPRLDDDMTSGSIDCIITGNDTTLEDLTEENGTIFFDVMTDSVLMALYFYAESPDSEIVIPEGIYTIDNSEDYYSVNASDGSIGTYPTFFATHDGTNFTSMYFLVSGTVEVKNKQGKLYMEINALNSYNVPAHIIYDASLATDVDEVLLSDKVQKQLKNGQLVILRNGESYNILGARL